MALSTAHARKARLRTGKSGRKTQSELRETKEPYSGVAANFLQGPLAVDQSSRENQVRLACSGAFRGPKYLQYMVRYLIYRKFIL